MDDSAIGEFAVRIDRPCRVLARGGLRDLLPPDPDARIGRNDGAGLSARADRRAAQRRPAGREPEFDSVGRACLCRRRRRGDDNSATKGSDGVKRISPHEIAWSCCTRGLAASCPETTITRAGNHHERLAYWRDVWRVADV